MTHPTKTRPRWLRKGARIALYAEVRCVEDSGWVLAHFQSDDEASPLTVAWMNTKNLGRTWGRAPKRAKGGKR
jgi:hypothetical protein